MQNFIESLITKSKTSKEIPDHKSKIEHAKKSRQIRDNLTEKKIDKMIDDSFPASDAPSTY